MTPGTTLFPLLSLLLYGFALPLAPASGPPIPGQPGESSPQQDAGATTQAAAEVFIDVGACPGEGCGYGTWKTLRPTVLLAAPDAEAAVVVELTIDEVVEAVTGEVHTVPGRFVVHSAITTRLGNSYMPGNVVSVYTYRGEGFFLVEFDGARYDEELGFSPWGGSPGRRCERSERCWGELQEELEFTWWVRIRTSAGTEGWTASVADFDLR